MVRVITKNGKYRPDTSKSRVQLAAVLLCLIGFCASCVFVYRTLKQRRGGDTFYNLRAQWKSYDYLGVYNTSSRILERLPLNNTALTYRGYAAFYLGMSMAEAAATQTYLDEAINCLRLSLLNARKSTKGQCQYMLGKAYFYKNSPTSHYYADLSIKYLCAAREEGYDAPDISEYLGLDYASLGDTMQSIAALSEALVLRESDTLLLSIAEQYGKVALVSSSEQYFFRVINGSKDDSLVSRARVGIAQLYLENGRYDEALSQYNELIKSDADNADAYYGLGLLYEKQGDMVKARAMWRKCLRLDVSHAGALERLKA